MLLCSSSKKLIQKLLQTFFFLSQNNCKIQSQTQHNNNHFLKIKQLNCKKKKRVDRKLLFFSLSFFCRFIQGRIERELKGHFIDKSYLDTWTLSTRFRRESHRTGWRGRTRGGGVAFSPAERQGAIDITPITNRTLALHQVVNQAHSFFYYIINFFN